MDSVENEKKNEIINEETTQAMRAYEYRMEAHAEDVIIGDYDPDKPVQRDIKKELEEMTNELLAQYQKYLSSQGKDAQK